MEFRYYSIENINNYQVGLSFIKTAFLLIDRRRIALLRCNRNNRLISQRRGGRGEFNSTLLLQASSILSHRRVRRVASTSETLAVYIIFRLFKGFIHRTNSIMGSKITCTVKFALIRSCRVAREGRLKRQAWTLRSSPPSTLLPPLSSPKFKFAVIRHAHVSPFFVFVTNRPLFRRNNRGNEVFAFVKIRS